MERSTFNRKPTEGPRLRRYPRSAEEVGVPVHSSAPVCGGPRRSATRSRACPASSSDVSRSASAVRASPREEPFGASWRSRPRHRRHRPTSLVGATPCRRRRGASLPDPSPHRGARTVRTQPPHGQDPRGNRRAPSTSRSVPRKPRPGPCQTERQPPHSHVSAHKAPCAKQHNCMSAASTDVLTCDHAIK